jgi:hypothetical protein
MKVLTSSQHRSVCLFEWFFNYLATVTITCHRTANLDLCLALTAFSSESSFTCHTCCDAGPAFLRSYPKDPWFYLLNAVLLAMKQPLRILYALGLTRPARAGLELTTSRLLSQTTTTKLRQPFRMSCQSVRNWQTADNNHLEVVHVYSL